MFEDWFKWFAEKYLNGCKTCLVRATCEPVSLHGKCDIYNKFLRNLTKAANAGGDMDVYTFVGLCLVGLGFFIITFCLGIWKWVELILF